MRISPIASSGFNYSKLNTKNVQKNNYFTNVVQKDVFNKSNFNASKSITFGSEPWYLVQPDSYRISANEGISLYKKLALGNYLDLNGDTKDANARSIRKENLEFLDKILTDGDKSEFINYYKKLTGFPNMVKVSRKIKQEFVRACSMAEKNCSKSLLLESQKKFFDILSAGYDGISSVAMCTALPGSDLDKAYVILRGCDDDETNEKIVSDFKAQLWKNTDQRILSYNHDADSFPKVYTLKQIMSIFDSINLKAKSLEIDKETKVPFKNKWEELFSTPKYITKRPEYESLMDSFNLDFTEANRFIVELAKEYRSTGTWDLPLNTENPSREDMYKASFVLEAMQKGDILIGDNVLKGKDTRNVELINLSQISAIKKSNKLKEKHILRQNLNRDFEQWDISKQFNLVKEMIKASCSDETEFSEYFSSDTSERFNSLLNELNVGGNDNKNF